MPRISGVLVLGATAILLAGCSSMGDYGARNMAAAPAPIQPVALAESDPIPPVQPRPAAVTATAVAVQNAGAMPNLGVAPPPTETHVLTPDEKARVVAELEAMARRQGEETARARAALADCAALDKLDPAERAKRVAAGAKC